MGSRDVGRVSVCVGVQVGFLGLPLLRVISYENAYSYQPRACLCVCTKGKWRTFQFM